MIFSRWFHFDSIWASTLGTMFAKSPKRSPIQLFVYILYSFSAVCLHIWLICQLFVFNYTKTKCWFSNNLSSLRSHWVNYETFCVYFETLWSTIRNRKLLFLWRKRTEREDKSFLWKEHYNLFMVFLLGTSQHDRKH